MPPKQKPKDSLPRVYIVKSQNTDDLGNTLVLGYDADTQTLMLQREADTPVDQHSFQVYQRGQIQNVALAAGDNGYLTRVTDALGNTTVTLQAFDKHEVDQLWNFLPGQWRVVDVDQYTLVVTPTKHKDDQQNILQTQGVGQPVVVVAWDGVTMPPDESWYFAPLVPDPKFEASEFAARQGDLTRELSQEEEELVGFKGGTRAPVKPAPRVRRSTKGR